MRLIPLLLVGCGVPGAPLPPGPVPPAAPSAVEVVRTPEGLEIHATAPEVDLDGAPLAEPPDLLLFVDQAACDGHPAVQAPAGDLLRLPTRLTTPLTLRVVAARGNRQGAPSAPKVSSWAPPPPALERPIAYADAQGQVQLTWLPPSLPVVEVRVLRDGAPVATVAAAGAVYTDAAPVGTHTYAVEGLGPGFRTAPSPTVRVEVR